jgi:hypothetical protein
MRSGMCSRSVLRSNVCRGYQNIIDKLCLLRGPASEGWNCFSDSQRRTQVVNEIFFARLQEFLDN